MFGLFRRRETPPEGPGRHEMMLDLIEQVAATRGQVRALEVEWEAVRAQIQKGWQRVEKANERSEKRATMEKEPEPEPAPAAARLLAPQGFAKKLLELRGS